MNASPPLVTHCGRSASSPGNRHNENGPAWGRSPGRRRGKIEDQHLHAPSMKEAYAPLVYKVFRQWTAWPIDARRVYREGLAREG